MKRPVLHLILALATCLMLLSACKPTIPSKYLQPDEMEDLLYDYYVSQGLNDNSKNLEYQRFYHQESVLRKYNITAAEFDSSLVYYYNHIELLNGIYTNIQKRLSKEALELGASEGEVERYTTQSLSGDTTDVWEGRRQLILMPIPPYQVVQFSQKADTSFHQGDSFLLTFGTKFLTQSGSRNATAGLSVTYENDSVASVSQSVSVFGGNTLRLSPCSLRAKKIEGFVYLAKRDPSSGNESELSLLFVDHIQLMRFHHRQNEQETIAAPAAISPKPETVDTMKPMVRRLGDLPRKIESENDQVDIKPIIKRQ